MRVLKPQIHNAVACLFEQRGACTFGMNLEPCAPVIHVIDPIRRPDVFIFDEFEDCYKKVVVSNDKPRSWKSYRHTQYGVM